MTCDCFPPRGEGDACTCEGCWACVGHVSGCTCDIAWDCEHEPSDGRRLKVMKAHLAADCPDRDNCWAAAIHNEHVLPVSVAQPPSLAQIVAALSVTYTNEGVLIWLKSKIEYVNSEIDEVAEAVRRIGDADPDDFIIISEHRSEESRRHCAGCNRPLPHSDAEARVCPSGRCGYTWVTADKELHECLFRHGDGWHLCDCGVRTSPKSKTQEPTGRAGCCSSCDGKGGGLFGPCSDCCGTGHCHEPNDPCGASSGGDRRRK